MDQRDAAPHAADSDNETCAGARLPDRPRHYLSCLKSRPRLPGPRHERVRARLDQMMPGIGYKRPPPGFFRNPRSCEAQPARCFQRKPRASGRVSNEGDGSAYCLASIRGRSSLAKKIRLLQKTRHVSQILSPQAGAGFLFDFRDDLTSHGFDLRLGEGLVARL